MTERQAGTLAAAIVLITLAFVLFMGTGCTETSSMPGQGQAERLVWVEAYGETGAPPAVDWSSNCSGPDGQFGVLDGDRCFGGLFFYGGWTALVPWAGSFHASAYAHELMHAKQALEHVFDPEHRITADWELVATVNASLEQGGL